MMQSFQQEMKEVEAHIRWKGAHLTDETRFTLCALSIGQSAKDGSGSWTTVERGVIRLIPAQRRIAMASTISRASAPKEYFGLWLSLLLDPGTERREVAVTALERLSAYGVDLDSALVGVLSSPEKLPLLPTLQYATADALVWRASPRLAPVLFTGAEADDRYLRSRSILGLGYLAYQSSGTHKVIDGLPAPMQTHSVSSMQRRLIEAQLEKALSDSSYRVRAASAASIGLMNWTEMIPRLQKLLTDPASIQRPVAGAKDSKEIEFPVRRFAAAALGRMGVPATAQGGVFSGKQLKEALRGAKNVTKDKDGVRFAYHAGIPIWAGDW